MPDYSLSTWIGVGIAIVLAIGQGVYEARKGKTYRDSAIINPFHPFRGYFRRW